MTSADMLYLLLWVSLGGACLQIGMSLVFVGRKLLDVEYQRASGVNGTRQIEAWTKVRTYGMRVLVGFAFGLFAVGLLAPIQEPWRMETNRSLFAIVPWGYVVVTALDWLAERAQLRYEVSRDLSAKAAEAAASVLAETQRTSTIRAELASYQQIADEAVVALHEAAARARTARGELLPPEMADVVPEHQSPITPAQQATANLQTMRANLTASKLALGLPARDAPPAEGHRDSVDVASIHPEAVDAIAQAVRDTPERGA